MHLSRKGDIDLRSLLARCKGHIKVLILNLRVQDVLLNCERKGEAAILKDPAEPVKTLASSRHPPSVPPGTN